ncbi:sugar transferase [Rhodococcus rhodochrous]|uniref:sugar transferase n=1 Tax=Rhodococcus rhodochrous TaxID=1829 RepID=UPI00177CAC75|nr:sugar transferase [Rhodococcus rhodochrous]
MSNSPKTFYQRRGKRIFDACASAALLVLTAPIHALCVLAVKVDSPGPVYFHQTRVGRHGQEFRLHKLRTMLVGTEELMKNYPTSDRITRSGKMLRRLSLDEIPQLWNIFRGEMSFVGPRPTIPDQAVRYTDFQRRRLNVTPGLTGLAQIRYRNNATWSVRIKSDVEYTEKIRFLTDLGLILRTVPAAFKGSGQLTDQTSAQVDDLGQGSTV